MRTTRRSVVLVGLVALAMPSACVSPATEVIVSLDSDAPPSRLLSVTVHTMRGDAEGDAGTGVLLHARDGGALSLPATFALVPAPGDARDESVTLVVDATVAPDVAGGAPLRLQHTARLRFVPNVTLRLPVYLSLLCGAATTGCTTVPAASCTLSVRCAETAGKTCGDDGTCVPIIVQPQPLMDAGTQPDVTSCAAGTTRCGASCVTLSNDPTNCGACNVQCAPDDACSNGVCGLTCQPGQTNCGGRCHDLSNDVSSCGTCGHACSLPDATAACVAGACALASCTQGHVDEDGVAANGCERTGLALQADGPHYRLLDSRVGATAPLRPGAPITAGSTWVETAVDASGLPLVAAMITGTLTVVRPATTGHLTIHPARDAGAPTTTTVNFTTGVTISAGFTTTPDFRITSTGTTDVVVDVSASYDVPPAQPSASYLDFHPLPFPVRLIDTRATGGMITAGTTRALQVGGVTLSGVALPPTVRAVTGWLTVVDPSGAGYASVYDPDATRPATSNLNFATSQDRTADFLVRTSTAGATCIGQTVDSGFVTGFDSAGHYGVRTNVATDVVVDAYGYFAR